MRLEQFVYDPAFRVYVPEGGVKDFLYSDGKEVEEYLWKVVLSARDKSSLSSELNSKIRDWPTRYHLSPLRANLFRAFSFFKKDKKVLEIGSGCGAITRYLGEVCGQVDAIEGSLKRAMIARMRCSDLEHVRVYVSDVFDLTFDPEYDVVTLIGVLEYAPIFSKDGEAQIRCLRLLEKCRQALKDEGILVIAIENKIGLKYLTGAKEDHTGILFDSLYDYPSVGDHPITFSKKELTELLFEAGYTFLQFYFPFPDYKLPDVIIRDCKELKEGKLYLHNWIRTPFEDYSGIRDFLIHEALLARTLCRAGILGEFANSFLVFASRKEPSYLDKEDWIAKSFSIQRDPSFMTVTTLYKGIEIKVVKERIKNEHSEENGMLSLRSETSEWIEGDLLSYEFYSAIVSKKDPENRLLELTGLLNRYLLSRYATGKFDIEGYPLVSGEAFDCTPWNIIRKNDNLVYIDKEWAFFEALSVDYVLFRGLYYLFLRETPFLKKNMALGIKDPEELTIFLIKHFYPHYDRDRLKKNKLLEKDVQAFVANRKSQLHEEMSDQSFSSEVFSVLLRLGLPASETSRILATISRKKLGLKA